MNSDTMWLSETDEETISYIVKNMKKSVFTGLDRYKEEAKKSDTNTPLFVWLRWFKVEMQYDLPGFK